VIVSASRRTDIPAFYAGWLLERLRAGSCAVQNPFNPAQRSTISLGPEDVEALVFWTKNPAPLLPHLPEIDARGFRYYFQFTLNDYPALLEPGVPPLGERMASFAALSGRIGRERVIWRYDPILISNQTGFAYHRERFGALSSALAPHTFRVVVSVAHYYRKTRRNLSRLGPAGLVVDEGAAESPQMLDLLAGLATIARSRGLEIVSCASERDFTALGIAPGRCIDGELLERLWGLRGPWKKDPGQRPACGCAVSKDLGAVDTCLHGCTYCYATANREAALARHRAHDPASPMLAPAPAAQGIAHDG
jgi:hypothetical protein